MVKKSFKVFGIFFIVLQLCSCIMYASEEKHSVTTNIHELKQAAAQAQGTPKIVADALKWDYFTTAHIKEIFGQPLKEEKDGKITRLYYQHQAKAPETSFILILLPLKYDNDNNNYQYAFVLENDKLTETVTNSVTGDIKAFGPLLWPPYIHKKTLRTVEPFSDNSCNNGLSEMTDFAFDNMNPQNTSIQKDCYNNSLLGFKRSKVTAGDISMRSDGYTKFSFGTLYYYDNNRFSFSRNDLWKLTKENFEALDKQRLKDITPVRERRFSNNEIDCKIYVKQGKDYQATNRGEHSYLLMDSATALCFMKKNDTVFEASATNRYPEYMANAVHTEKELLAILKTVKALKNRKME